MQNVQIQFVKKSANAKTGPIPVTVTERASCPDSCKFKGSGCYYEAGFHTRINWDAIDKRKRGGSWESMCEQVKAIPAGSIWRHNVGGDLPHRRGYIDGAKVGKLAFANAGKAGFTYTHHDMTIDTNRAIVRMANRVGFTVNLSGDNLAHADTLADMAIGPVVVVLPIDQMENTQTPNGRRVVVCPAVKREGVTCSSCKLCARADRSVIVGFPAHGSGKRAAERVAMS
jgi:hypothetical protein